jgi:hypothetical protein
MNVSLVGSATEYFIYIIRINIQIIIQNILEGPYLLGNTAMYFVQSKSMFRMNMSLPSSGCRISKIICIVISLKNYCSKNLKPCLIEPYGLMSDNTASSIIIAVKISQKTALQSYIVFLCVEAD